MKKFVFGVLSVISISAFSQKPTGKIVIKSGQHYMVESTTNSVINQEMMGQSMEMKVGAVAKMTADITPAKENTYTVSQTITNIKSTFSGMGQEKTFDSDKKEDMDSEAGAIYKDKINVPTVITVTSEGKTIVATDTTKKDKEETNPMVAMMSMMGGSQDAAATLFLVIPAGKKAGDTWQDSSSKEGFKMKKTYTLNSINNKEASVTIDGVTDVNKKIQMQGMDMNAVMVSKVNATILVDLASSVQKENKSTTDVSGTIDVMGQSVPVTSKIIAVTTIKSM